MHRRKSVIRLSDEELQTLQRWTRLTVAVRKGAILAVLAPAVSAAIKTEPFSVVRKRALERPGAVKGAPFFGAAKRTLDGEDRSDTM